MFIFIGYSDVVDGLYDVVVDEIRFFCFSWEWSVVVVWVFVFKDFGIIYVVFIDLIIGESSFGLRVEFIVKSIKSINDGIFG